MPRPIRSVHSIRSIRRPFLSSLLCRLSGRCAPPALALALLGASLPLAAPHTRAADTPGARTLGGLRADGPRLAPRLVPRLVPGATVGATLGGVMGVGAHAKGARTSDAQAGGAAGLPASADISRYNPPVADQGDVNACVAWVTTYYMRGWYARRDGYYPAGGADGAGGFAPMYLYSQLTGGGNAPTSFAQTLDLQVAQGVDTRADYTQGDKDYTNGPTAAERSSAASYKISGYTVLFRGAGQGDAARTAIETSIAGGDPVGLGIPVYDNFWNADAGHAYVDGAPGANYGNHAVFATRYDANGVWVENQWGTGWGQDGWVELSWSFVDQYAWEAVTIQPLDGPASPAASATTPTAPAATASVPAATASVPAATPTTPLARATVAVQATTAPSVAPTVASTTTTQPATPAPAHQAVTIQARGRGARGPRPRASRTVAHSVRGHGSNIVIVRGRARGLQPHVAPRGGPVPARGRANAPRTAGCVHRLYGHALCAS